ncbi:MAG: IS607 family transposase [Microcoleus sp. PH2017_10_PVI_O_A]|uniref:IS607 family transposase n=1 Tax=unclassified Microcoleus TaxID=2642155 RepID=UPI001E12B565|nr:MULTISPECIES: IS607 family transposase [unclassified Microcoleus]TAE81574.1 MAG: IS607 family transposase [Oscillatoriales cyanobacterium]MCC3404923.1 IS607 family transposase [Microcoleus sp. PH2017_10_PVI_O_A]MCC3461146.1 IS607 family transposase [Microcoleus sp. PH2017_11_PCY_U_A]MCC3479148.1 IS607 family transposase [Microcoleus sp. PH2017_12_PCY_D_A]MCC3527324.1 IS607 family transposase [Microcoleus sp. PH2017_21_RUC_O_A]
MAKYVKPNEAANTLGVCLRTLRRWEAEDKINTIKTPSGQRRYDIEKFIKKESEPEGGRATVIYARVSTRPQKTDLDRQIERLSTLYPGAEIVKEVGGGLNLRRKGLITLLGRVLRGDIAIIVVAHKDRLARFGFDIIEWLCEQFDCKIVVLNQISLSPHAELVQDIVAILHSFSSRLYSIRRLENQIKQELQVESKAQEGEEVAQQNT